MIIHAGPFRQLSFRRAYFKQIHSIFQRTLRCVLVVAPRRGGLRRGFFLCFLTRHLSGGESLKLIRFWIGLLHDQPQLRVQPRDTCTVKRFSFQGRCLNRFLVSSACTDDSICDVRRTQRHFQTDRFSQMLFLPEHSHCFGLRLGGSVTNICWHSFFLVIPANLGASDVCTCEHAEGEEHTEIVGQRGQVVGTCNDISMFETQGFLISEKLVLRPRPS